MEIARIISKGRTLSTLEKALREEMFVPSIEIAPAWLSAFTAMKVQKAIDREKAQIIEVTTIDDILTAISARKISNNPGAKIVVNLPPNSPTPLTLPQELCQNANLWLFPSEAMKNEFQALGTLKNTAILAPAYFGEIERATVEPDGNIHFVAILTARPCTDRIIKIINAVDALPAPVKIHFLGQAEAKYIMPAIQHVHNLDHPERVVWEGDNYRLGEQLSRARAVIKTNRDLTENECAGASIGTPAIDIECLAEVVNDTTNLPCTSFCEKHNPQFHVEQFSKSIINL